MNPLLRNPNDNREATPCNYTYMALDAISRAQGCTQDSQEYIVAQLHKAIGYLTHAIGALSRLEDDANDDKRVDVLLDCAEDSLSRAKDGWENPEYAVAKMRKTIDYLTRVIEKIPLP